MNRNLRAPANPKGFALVVTVLMMVLLSILAVGMLSLSAVSLRSSSQGDSMAEARANARLALMLAIGELQRNTGPDTRITAPADIIEPGAPPLTGVWKSWEGTDHDSTGRPLKPDYTVKTKSETDSGRFLTWLVSGAVAGNNPSVTGNKPSDLVATTTSAVTVPLLAGGTLGSNPGQVHVKPQLVKNNTGAIAWWVSPENQKARLIQPHKPRTDDAAGWSAMAKSHSVPDPGPFGLETLLNDPENYNPDPSSPKLATKALTLATSKLLVEPNPAQPQQSFHDLSTSAVGLLTNTATGGWRKDMSILTERWDQINSGYPAGKLPLFRYSPEIGKTSMAVKPTVTNYEPSQSNFYPWSGYHQLGAVKLPMLYQPASASWQSLVKYATRYKSIAFDGATNTAKAPIGWTHIIGAASNQNFYNAYHNKELNPVVARIQLIVQVNALPDPALAVTNPAAAALNHRLNLRIVPVVTLWNPYNVMLSKTVGSPYRPGVDLDIGISTMASLPVVMAIINGTMAPSTGFEGNYKLMNGGNNRGIDATVGFDYSMPENVARGYNKAHFPMTSRRSFTAYLPLEFSLKPGGVKVFSPRFNAFQNLDQGVRMKEGYATGDNFGMPIVNPEIPGELVSKSGALVRVPGRPANELHATDQVKFAVKADRHTKNYKNVTSTKTGAGTNFMIGTTNPGWAISLAQIQAGETDKGVEPNNIRSVLAANVDEDWAEEYWPSSNLEEAQYNVSELVPGGDNPPWTNLYSISFGPRFAIGAGYGHSEDRPTRGLLQASPFSNNTFSVPEREASYHPANLSYDLAYHSMSINDEHSPEVGLEGYIATGFQSGDGFSRLVMAEVPLRPLSSLAELQSWDLRGDNPLPPFQYNLIANSEATPLIQQDGILMNSPVTSAVAQNLQHDDAYCANHLLFDDWFLSSVAPEPQNFGSAMSKDLETVYKEFLKGERRLANRAYRPCIEDAGLSGAAASARFAEMVGSADGWLKIASRLEVEGMFNVNSLSTKAWRALLGHARRQHVAYHAANGIELAPSEHEHVVSRATVAGDVKASTDTGIGAAFTSGSELTGFRTLSDAQLDELAEKIVMQVRQRGPFLSLSEFVNRQLSLNDDLALAGALQAALDSLTDDPLKALKDPAKQLSSETMDPDDDKLDGVGYAFVKASEGMSTHGFPGWIRQADILRPIAPILSARDDTFTIRAYGDARDAQGNVTARAWCEATVQRGRDFLDPQDAADSTNPPANDQNKVFGRRYSVVSFRWLSKEEV